MSQDRPFVSTFIPLGKSKKQASKSNNMAPPPPVVVSTNKRSNANLGSTPAPSVTVRRKTGNNVVQAQIISKYVNTARKKAVKTSMMRQQTLRANNKSLARALQRVKEENRTLRENCIEKDRQINEMRSRLGALQTLDNIEEIFENEVNERVKAPFTTQTEFDVWRMVWQTRPTVIVLLTTGDFWPNTHKTKTYAEGRLLVRTDQMQISDQYDSYDITVRSAQLPALHLQLLHYSEWSNDENIPKSLCHFQSELMETMTSVNDLIKEVTGSMFQSADTLQRISGLATKYIDHSPNRKSSSSSHSSLLENIPSTSTSTINRETADKKIHALNLKDMTSTKIPTRKRIPLKKVRPPKPKLSELSTVMEMSGIIQEPLPFQEEYQMRTPVENFKSPLTEPQKTVNTNEKKQSSLFDVTDLDDGQFNIDDDLTFRPSSRTGRRATFIIRPSSVDDQDNSEENDTPEKSLDEITKSADINSPIVHVEPQKVDNNIATQPDVDHQMEQHAQTSDMQHSITPPPLVSPVSRNTVETIANNVKKSPKFFKLKASKKSTVEDENEAKNRRPKKTLKRSAEPFDVSDHEQESEQPIRRSRRGSPVCYKELPLNKKIRRGDKLLPKK